jgi:tetratricopeptide (TPR) repeat protein
MQKSVFLLLFIFSSLLLSCSFRHGYISQQLSGDRKRADLLFEEGSYMEAATIYKNLLSKDSTNTKAMVNLAEALMMLHKNEEAEAWYSKALNLNSSIPTIQKFHYAEILLYNGKNEEASKWFEICTKEESDNRSKNKIRAIDNYFSFLSDSLAYTIKPLSINSEQSDFCPSFYKKGIVFLSSRNTTPLVKYVNMEDESSFLELYYSEFQNDTSFSEPTIVDDFNTTLHHGPATFFDNDTKVIFSRNQKSLRGNGFSRLWLFYSERSPGTKKWSNPKPLPFNSNQYSLSHPYYHSKNKTLYFSSDMPGGQGKTDLYKSYFREGQWTNPVNLGKEINTNGNDLFPFVSKDSCLYFTSNGHAGMGGLDIYRTDLKDSTLTIQNLGYPINSNKDDFGLIIKDNGSIGYFCSNRKKGDDDIYEVQLHSIRFEGIVVDKLKGMPQTDVIVRVTELETGKIDRLIKTNIKGKFNCFIRPGKTYKIEIIKESYRPNVIQIPPQAKGITSLRRNFKIEKVHKAYVNGKVVKDTSHISNCTVKIIDFYSDSIETILTDNRGEFQCEINIDTTNFFYIEKDGLKGIWKIDAIKNKKKASRVTYITLRFGVINTKKLTGMSLDSTGAIISNDTLYFKNQFTDEEIAVVTDEKGKFVTELWLHGKYNAYTKENDNKIFQCSFVPDKTSQLIIRRRKYNY